MRYILKRLGYLIILFAPIDAFKIFGSYFSLYRITVIFSFVIIVFDILNNKGIFRINNKSTLRTLIVFLICNLVCISVSDKTSLGVSYFFTDLLGILVIFELIYIFKDDSKEKLLLTYIRSQYITLGFSIYAIYLHFFWKMKLSISWSFLFLSFHMSENSISLLSRSKSFLPMLFMPYATTLHLDMSVGIAAIICLYFFVDRHKIQYLILGGAYSSLILLSAQKGPIITFTVSILIFIKYYRKKMGVKKTTTFLMIALFIVFIVIIGFAKEIIQYTILRFKEFGQRISMSEDRHVLLVYEAIYVWLDELKNFFIGVGYSGYAMINGKYTYVPENFLSTYATLIAERGIISIFTMYFYVKPLIFYRKYKDVIYNLTLFILLNYIFYELRYIQTSWVIYGIIYCCMTPTKKLREI